MIYRKYYKKAVARFIVLDFAELLCQSSQDSVGGGSLVWDGEEGNDPTGNGSDFEWGN